MAGHIKQGGAPSHMAGRLHEQGEWRAVTGQWHDYPVSIAFPSAMALSHMWLDKAHPDANARNLREICCPRSSGSTRSA